MCDGTPGDDAALLLECLPAHVSIECSKSRIVNHHRSGRTALRLRWHETLSVYQRVHAVICGDQSTSFLVDLWTHRANERDSVAQPSTKSVLECLLTQCDVTSASVRPSLRRCTPGRRGSAQQLLSRLRCHKYGTCGLAQRWCPHNSGMPTILLIQGLKDCNCVRSDRSWYSVTNL